MVPITQNQLGVWREMEALENVWCVERDPSSPTQQQPLSPEAGIINQEHIDVGEELNVPTTCVTPEGGSFTVFGSATTSEKLKKRQKRFQKSLSLQT